MFEISQRAGDTLAAASLSEIQNRLWWKFDAFFMNNSRRTCVKAYVLPTAFKYFKTA